MLFRSHPPTSHHQPAATRWTNRRHRRQDQFAALTSRLYPPPIELATRLTQALPGDVRVCRCEAVTAAQIRAAASPTVPSGIDAGTVRALTRAGMGPCQGRECATAVGALCGTGPVAPAQPRMPVRPVPLTAIATLATPAPDPMPTNPMPVNTVPS